MGRNNIDIEDCDYLYNFGRDKGNFNFGLAVDGYAQLDQGFVFANPRTSLHLTAPFRRVRWGFDCLSTRRFSAKAERPP